MTLLPAIRLLVGHVIEVTLATLMLSIKTGINRRLLCILNTGGQPGIIDVWVEHIDVFARQHHVWGIVVLVNGLSRNIWLLLRLVLILLANVGNEALFVDVPFVDFFFYFVVGAPKCWKPPIILNRTIIFTMLRLPKAFINFNFLRDDKVTRSLDDALPLGSV